MFKIGDTVEYIKPFHDEIGTKYEVTFVDTAIGYCEFRALIDMVIRPLYSAPINDMRLVHDAR